MLDEVNFVSSLVVILVRLQAENTVGYILNHMKV